VSQAQKSTEAVVGISVAAGVLGAMCIIMLAVLVYKIRMDKFKVDKSTLFH